ncbi:hypothetical protein GGR57DRAFT_70222 [Xylariaceae sp. FL1272]|nr:hypothetical protein GGR57DRAFT_70222 [Xylariaceae sp. FL1272]
MLVMMQLMRLQVPESRCLSAGYKQYPATLPMSALGRRKMRISREYTRCAKIGENVCVYCVANGVSDTPAQLLPLAPGPWRRFHMHQYPHREGLALVSLGDLFRIGMVVWITVLGGGERDVYCSLRQSRMSLCTVRRKRLDRVLFNALVSRKLVTLDQRDAENTKNVYVKHQMRPFFRRHIARRLEFLAIPRLFLLSFLEAGLRGRASTCVEEDW